MPEVTFLPDSVTVEMPADALLLEGARLAGVFIETPCGGRGACRKCAVKVTDARGDTYEALICQTPAGNGPLTVTLPKPACGKGKFGDYADPSKFLYERGTPFVRGVGITAAAPAPQDGLSDADRLIKAFITATGRKNAELPLSVLSDLPVRLRENDGKTFVHYYAENETAKIISVSGETAYGLAVDIGTTTVALWLVDLNSAEAVFADNAYNGQAECGLDVISRINYARKSLPELRERVLGTVNELAETACGEAGVLPDSVLCVSITGNTTMIHLLLGIVPEHIRLFPYTPAVFRPMAYAADKVGILANKEAPVLIAPAVGSYVGGDITAGLLCTSLAARKDETAKDELILFIDLGTNGEIALGNDEFIFACACSAGPAFEGGGLKYGVRASDGAIERVMIDEAGRPETRTIGDAPPIGICGSGIISAVAEFYRKGVIDQAGKFTDGSDEYQLCGGITVCATDIDNVIRAKGAVFSACQTMLDMVGLSFGDIDMVYVAGGFGRYLDLTDARTIGLLPRIPDEKYAFLGNSSVVGAYLALVSEERREKINELANRITYVDLSGEPGYMDRYTAALFLPHTDGSLFI